MIYDFTITTSPMQENYDVHIPTHSLQFIAMKSYKYSNNIDIVKFWIHNFPYCIISTSICFFVAVDWIAKVIKDDYDLTEQQVQEMTEIDLGHRHFKWFCVFCWQRYQVNRTHKAVMCKQARVLRRLATFLTAREKNWETKSGISVIFIGYIYRYI